MHRRKVKIIIVAIFVFSCIGLNDVLAMIKVNDKISSSWPNVGANHLISFLTVENIPPSGRIEIIPEGGKFFISDGFDYTDVDLATSLLPNGPFTDREVGIAVNGTDDGVVAVANSANGKIDIILNSTTGIPSGTYVQIKLGSSTVYGDIGDKQIINPSLVGSYKVDIRTYDETNYLLKRSQVLIAIVQPIRMTGYPEKRRMNGSPIGWLTYGTQSTILSIVTNYEARCRYSLSSSTPFLAMADTFLYTDSSYIYYHTIEISGLVAGTTYNYYVRCQDTKGNKDEETNCDYIASTTPYETELGEPITSLKCFDYWIPFYISGQAGTTGDASGSGDTGTDVTSSGSGGGTGSGGSGGSGGGSGGGRGTVIGRTPGRTYLPYPPLPGAPGLVLNGWGYPSSEVAVLKDGAETGFMLANAAAEFGGFVENLSKGVYTFTLWSTDASQRRGANYSTTFYIDDGTQTTVANIMLPPTISVNKTALNPGELLQATGITLPKGNVEAWLYLKKNSDPKEIDIVKIQGMADTNGVYFANFDTSLLVVGEYLVKARTRLPNSIETSGFSQSLAVNVGQAEKPDTGACAGADLNKDGKVNITDFSILLYYWGTDNACADQNANGKVDLPDFSIMMYYWTG